MKQFYAFVITAAYLGLGTAMVYPTFLASVADLVHPQDRAESVRAFRLWRDLGYAFGALLAGIIADYFNLMSAITFVGILTLFSTLYFFIRMDRLNRSINDHQDPVTKDK